MKTALLGGLKRIVRRLAKLGHLAHPTKADRTAELIWSLVHPTAWRQLVVGCGWSPQEFRRSRLELVRPLVR